MAALGRLLTDYWLVIGLALVVAAALARLGFGKRVYWPLPIAAGLVILGYVAIHVVATLTNPSTSIEGARPGYLGSLRYWEWAGWISLGIAGLFVLSLVNLVFTGMWSRRLAWI